MIGPGAQVSDETKAWLRHIGWSVASAVLVGVAQKAVDVVVDAWKARRARGPQ